jgi:hypothetical protein
MKKIILALLITVTVTGAFAQDSKFGIKGGMNLSDLYTNDVESSNFRIGYHAGLFAKLAFSDRFAIQPEVLYSTKGSCLEYENAVLAGRANFNLNYIDIPVLAVVNITSRYNIQIGPYFSLLTGAKLINEAEGTDIFDFERELETDDFTFADYGIAAGIGIDFKHIGIGLRYNHGFQNIGKKRTFEDVTYRLPDATNGLFQVYMMINLLGL